MKGIQVQLVIEIMGRPADNVKQALAAIITKLENEKGITILERTFHEPLPLKDTDLFTAFVDVLVEADSLENYFYLLFAYMPSHSEIIYPEAITLDNARMNQFANQLIQKLHNYDSLAKNMLVERDIFFKKVQELAPNVISALFPNRSQTPPTITEIKPSETKIKKESKSASKKKVKKKS